MATKLFTVRTSKCVPNAPLLLGSRNEYRRGSDMLALDMLAVPIYWRFLSLAHFLPDILALLLFMRQTATNEH